MILKVVYPLVATVIFLQVTVGNHISATTPCDYVLLAHM